mmetsp:Transcript_8161/g.22558  ORF Transcript_8161/g.22558 Transcript_8161/m.22558 type:complete len:710 (+) Transcript_8161:79-2208(+)
MKGCAVLCLAALLLVTPSLGLDTNPLAKVLDLLGGLEAKALAEGEAELKAYKAFFEWCDDVAKNGEQDIKTAQSQQDKLEAKIGDLASDISVADSRVADLAASVSQADAEHKNATLIRDKESADFASSEHELVDTIDTVDRAINMLQKEMVKNPAFAQTAISVDLSNTLNALSEVLDAAAMPATDAKKLLGLVQSHEASENDDMDLGAPAAATYKTHSGGIIDVLEDLKEKAEGELADVRKAEVNAKHNYEMLAQSLQDQMNQDSKDMDDEKSQKAAAEEGKATAEGDLEVTKKDLANALSDQDTAKSSCMTTAADHEATVASRSEELKAIATAEKILTETSSGAVEQSYSLFQVNAGSSMQTSADLARSEVITLIKRLAKDHHSLALAQLASRIAAVVRFGSSAGEDPFAKVKALITDMISKLEGEASSETTEKAYCDEQISRTEAKKGELDDDLAKMTSRIDQAAAKAADLRSQVQELGAALAKLMKEQAEMDSLRAATHEDFVKAKADLELGLNGVRKALGVLRDYYGGGAALVQDAASFSALMQQPAAPEKHAAASGTGSSILGILEVVESDFAKNLAKEESEEDDAQSEYDKITQENKVTKTMKDQDVKYKTAEAQSLDKTISDLSSDRETTNTEHAAVMEFYAKIKERCIAKPETYEERKRRRVEEIAGLKEALNILEQETAFVQRPGRKGRSFRGSVLAAAF